jgi:hypothetical protein
VHSRNKQPLGRRLADAALNIVYHRKEVQYLGPLYVSARAITGRGEDAVGLSSDGGVAVSVEVSFDPASVVAGLRWVDGAHCPVEDGVPFAECSWFSVQTEDGLWHNATGSLTKDHKRLVLTTLPILGERNQTASSASTTAAATSFGFSPWPVTALYSGDLPVFPWNRRMADKDRD